MGGGGAEVLAPRCEEPACGRFLEPLAPGAVDSRIRGCGRQFHMQTLIIYKLGFNQNYYNIIARAIAVIVGRVSI